jgi:protein involved in temperature-dependent protein secretion
MTDDAYRGLGQRIIATDTGETPWLDIRSLTIASEDSGQNSADVDHA